jgi:YbgC/YbaW family acyl-CoA thioester hydrolase
MASDFKTRRRVEFAETDMAGILHFANYYRYMEEAEHAFFRSLGLRVHVGGDGVMGWVRVAAECRFQAPLCYEDVVELHVLVREKRTRSLRYEVVFRKVSAGRTEIEPVEVARGSMTVVCVARSAGGNLEAVPIPADVDARVEVAP